MRPTKMPEMHSAGFANAVIHEHSAEVMPYQSGISAKVGEIAPNSGAKKYRKMSVIIIPHCFPLNFCFAFVCVAISPPINQLIEQTNAY